MRALPTGLLRAGLLALSLPPLALLTACEGASAAEARAASRASSARGDADADGGARRPPPICTPEGAFVGLDAVLAGPPEAEGRGDEGGRGGEGRGEGGGEAHGDGPPPPDPLLHLLGIVYDIDQSFTFDEGESATLTADLSAHCAAVHATLDADGDGLVSEAEGEAGAPAACPPPEGPPPADGAPPFGPLEQAFDADEDGALSEDELATLRETVREGLRAGELPAC